MTEQIRGVIQKQPLVLADEELLRWQVVCEVRAKLLLGMDLVTAVRAVAAHSHTAADGRNHRVGKRSIYRWIASFTAQGISGLKSAPRPQGVGLVLSQALLDFVREEKKVDRYASVPELIRRARARDILSAMEKVDRTTVYRACRRLNLPLRRVPAKSEVDQRRFAYPHRMMMVMADGKHFRAGIRRTRRLAFFFLDDASRKVLCVVVGTAESSSLFLRGLHKLIQRFGLMDTIFLDNGPGFKADDTVAVCVNLGIGHILGTAGYPEGHGKIERFNQTAGQRVLRGLSGAADVDDDCGALELRLEHFLIHGYNQTKHESLDCTPEQRWLADTRALRFPDSEDALKEHFVVSELRKVCNDNVLSYDGIDYEVPRGHATARIEVKRRLLCNELLVMHDGRLVKLHPVDLAANAIAKRAHPHSPAPNDDEGTPITAAALAFARDYGPVTKADGGFVLPKNDPLTDSNQDITGDPK